MSIPDELIESYFVHCTRVPMEEVEGILKAENPRDAKLRLGREIENISRRESAREAEAYFVSTFPNEAPQDIRKVKLTGEMSLLDFLVQEGFATSRGDARRKIEQGGVEIDGVKVLDRDFTLTNTGKPSIIKCGKRFCRVVFPALLTKPVLKNNLEGIDGAPFCAKWLFGHPFEGVEDFQFQSFFRNVGAFFYRELPSHVSASWDVKGVLRSMGVSVACRRFQSFLGAVRIYEEDHHFLQPKVPPTEIFLPFRNTG